MRVFGPLRLLGLWLCLKEDVILHVAPEAAEDLLLFVVFELIVFHLIQLPVEVGHHSLIEYIITFAKIIHSHFTSSNRIQKVLFIFIKRQIIENRHNMIISLILDILEHFFLHLFASKWLMNC